VTPHYCYVSLQS